jgi:hypothetical protein
MTRTSVLVHKIVLNTFWSHLHIKQTTDLLHYFNILRVLKSSLFRRGFDFEE